MDTSPLDRHSRIALMFSGGKDSLACVYLLRPHLDRITLYHLDTGDQLPETRTVVDHVQDFAPRFVTIKRDVGAWIAENGMPTDLLPYDAHPIGRAIGEARFPLVARYDCCWANLMGPAYERVRDDGNTLLIRGTKSADMARLPASNGQTVDGMELFYPVQDWSHADVLAYLAEAGAPISPFYSHAENGPECATCPAWWGERRNAYLRDRHPALHAVYRARLAAVAGAIAGPLAALNAELSA
jgi:phosphoadenosine phosphosulfate reductase